MPHELTNRINQDLADAPDVLRELRADRDRIDEDIKRIERFVKAMTPKTPPVKKTRNLPRSQKALSDKALSIKTNDAEIAKAILMWEDDEFTVTDIWQMTVTDINKPTVAQTFRRFRNAGFLGKVGVHGKVQKWKIIDTERAALFTTSSTEA